MGWPVSFTWILLAFDMRHLNVNTALHSDPLHIAFGSRTIGLMARPNAVDSHAGTSLRASSPLWTSQRLAATSQMDERFGRAHRRTRAIDAPYNERD